MEKQTPQMFVGNVHKESLTSSSLMWLSELSKGKRAQADWRSEIVRERQRSGTSSQTCALHCHAASMHDSDRTKRVLRCTF